jgi:predicted ester cyclase
MTREHMIATAEKAIAAFNDPARRDEYFDTLYDDDLVLHGYTPEPLTPKETVKDFYGAIFEGFPDAHVMVEQALVDGDRLTLGFRFAGTHDGTFMGVPATGRHVDVPGITILRFAGERCVERWSVADFLGLMIQMGAIPVPA